MGRNVERVAPAPPEVYENGACVDMETRQFFSIKHKAVSDAKRVCATCPVQHPCLAYAMDNGIGHGIWGGLTEKERRRLKKRL